LGAQNLISPFREVSDVIETFAKLYLERFSQAQLDTCQCPKNDFVFVPAAGALKETNYKP
jgi:hypothetical protein